eukprot:TRINITY_DN57_c0_g1_i3.p1 TRINITY_DN57_c0_g1~~TRINITY_DN57_c0_g1_i3.p1  ORF type:complete len:316 (+),score=76.21 TRINITY_DN57_c0_g1_i3:56-1003(+)
MKLALVIVMAVAVMANTAQAGYFECGVCQSLLHFWSNARVESTFESVCDAFPNYVPMRPDPKLGAVPITDKDAPHDTKHGLPVSHMERCRRVMDTVLLRLAEEGIVSVKDQDDAQVFAPTTWENPAILEILCTYVYPTLGGGYCKGTMGGSVDDKCKACINYVHLAKTRGTNNPSCADRPEGEQELCKVVEDKLNALPSGGNTISGTIRAISHARDLDLLEGRFLACRDFLGLCSEEVTHPLKNPMKASYQEMQDQYNKAYDPYWASRNLYTVPNGAHKIAALQTALGTKGKREPSPGALKEKSSSPSMEPAHKI